MARGSSRLGVGVGFPLLDARSFRWVGEAEVVEQALRQLLLTEPGERLGRPGYGCGLQQFVFAPNSVETRTLIRETVAVAIERWEGRARLDAVDVTQHRVEPTVLLIEVRYRIVGDPRGRSLIHPFSQANP
jgi:Bacteriophage baseplate protein W